MFKLKEKDKEKEEESTKETSGKRVMRAPEEDIEAIVTVGAKRIATLHRRYTNFELTQIQDRAIAQKKLEFWERGYKRYLLAFIIGLIVSSLLGWWFADSLASLAKKFYISNGVTYSIYCSIVYMALYNVCDVGRIVVFIRELRGLEADEREIKEMATDTKEEEEEEIDPDELVADVEELLKENRGMSSTEIIRELSLNAHPQMIGNILANANFKQIISGGKRKWFIKNPKPSVQENTDNTSATPATPTATLAATPATLPITPE